MNNNQGNEITYILIKNSAKEIIFYKKEGKNFAEVPKGTRITAADGGWVLETPDGKSASLDARPIILIQ